MHALELANAMLFLSTLSLRRATAGKHAQPPTQQDFYPRSPCGERRVEGDNFFYYADISIHALLAESDRSEYPDTRQPCAISIHALLAESDRLCTILYSCPGNFYPRSPCGERQREEKSQADTTGAISIHALLAESDLILRMAHLMELLFLSTLSLRRATRPTLFDTAQHIYFYPRSPCGERQNIRNFAERA